MKIYFPTKFFVKYFEVSNWEKIYSISNQSDYYKFKLRRDIQIVNKQKKILPSIQYSLELLNVLVIKRFL